MRRLASRSRDDKYNSRRDYQTLHEARSLRLRCSTSGRHHLTFHAQLDNASGTSDVGAGGFLHPSAPTTAELELISGTQRTLRAFHLDDRWNRVGLALANSASPDLTLHVSWSGKPDLHLWGLTAGRIILPEQVAALEPSVDDLQRTYLCPETFYFRHDSALSLDIDPEQSSEIDLDSEAGAHITLKKCSYCGRLLPVDPRRLGTLSFHKHNAKRTLHQNECRACKKWRINDDLNPLRIVDQFHESSVIGRERRLFLREPEVLQRIKDRTGAGLKSQVWERFDRKCFYCARPLALDEVQLDHTRPLAYLWPIDEHATCLCAEHNNQKKDKFPVDFYSDPQLHELARVCGLPYDELRRKSLNISELQRILDDLSSFATEWDPRTFAATARKIQELRPDIDLYALLRTADASAYELLQQALLQRPAWVVSTDNGGRESVPALFTFEE